MVSRSRAAMRRDGETAAHDAVATSTSVDLGDARRVVRGLRHDVRQRPRVAPFREIEGVEVPGPDETAPSSRLDLLLSRRDRALRSVRLSEEKLAARQAEAARIEARLRALLLRTTEPALASVEPSELLEDGARPTATTGLEIVPLLSPPRPPAPGEHLTRRDPDGARLHARLDRALRRLDICEQSFPANDPRRIDAARDVAELRDQLDRLRPRLLWNVLERERARERDPALATARAAGPFVSHSPGRTDPSVTLDLLVDECSGLRHAIEELRREAFGPQPPKIEVDSGDPA